MISFRRCGGYTRYMNNKYDGISKHINIVRSNFLYLFQGSLAKAQEFAPKGPFLGIPEVQNYNQC